MAGLGAQSFLAGDADPVMTAISIEIFAHRFRATSAGWITVAGVLRAVTGLALFGWVGDVVHASSSTGLPCRRW